MNHIYQLVWNEDSGQCVPAPECARARGKRSGKPATVLLTGTLLGALALPALAQSLAPDTLPTGGQVVSGQATIGQSGNQMTIQQGTDRAILHWQGFDIGSQANVTFQQPSASAVALNRVLAGDASRIEGVLNANGQVWLVNPAGVIFGQGARVDVGGLVASTLDTRNDDFLNGRMRFSRNGAAGAIENHGEITAADGGLVALLAPTVRNEGVIQARLGSVVLAAGDAITLEAGADGHLQVALDPATVHTLIENRQLIIADGGEVVMTSAAADALAAGVVANSGTVQARTLQEKDGRILLLADMQHGEVRHDGLLDASAPEGGDGGFVETSAAKVSVGEDARVTTRAEIGQTGTWLIDPVDFTIAATGGDISGATLSSNLAGGSVMIQSIDGSAGTNGDIHVNDTVSWSANTLTLMAARDININAPLNGSGTADLALGYGQGNVSAGNTAKYHVRAAINLPAGQHFATKLGYDGAVATYTVLTHLGAAGSSTGADLQGINGNLSGNYVLGADIDASATSGWNLSMGFTPIGNATNPFTGTFDGLGHTINNLAIDRSGTDNIGLFGYVDGAVLRNVGLEGGSITGDSKVGGLVGYNNNSAISNSYATGSVTGASYVGGLVGRNINSAISNSYATGSVTGINTVGGLVGDNFNSSSISNSYATGNVTGYSWVGGLVGYNNNSAISNSYATGNVMGNDSRVGGLVGYNSSLATVTASYWDSYSTGRSQAIGQDDNGTNGPIFEVSSDPTKSGQFDYAFSQHAYSFLNFTSVWFMIDGETRPFLRSEYSTTIRNAHQLQLMAMNRSARYTLVQSIDASETARNDGSAANSSGMWRSAGFAPIGNITSKFTGTFDGLGHTISNLAIDRSGTDHIGLFGYADGAVLSNMGLVGGSIQGRNYVGGLVGASTGGSTVANSYATGSVAGDNYVGGLVGTSTGGSTVANSYATGSVAGNNAVGGLVGNNAAAVQNSYAAALVTGNGGGLLGSNSGTVSNSFWDTEASGRASSAGGTGLSAAQMKTLASFSSAGWSISGAGADGSIWRIYDGDSTPLLRSFLNPLAITSVASASRVYDGSTYVGGNGYVVPGADPGLIHYGGSAQGARNAGSYAITLWSGQQGYDLIGSRTSTLTISPRVLTLSAPSISKTYDGGLIYATTSDDLDVLSGQLLGGDRVTAATLAYTNKNAGNGKTVTFGGVTLSDGNGGNNYVLDLVGNSSGSITPKVLTLAGIGAANKIYDGTTAATLDASGVIFDGVVGGDSLTLTGAGTGSFDDKHVGTGKAVSVSGYALGGADASNYSVLQPTGLTADITVRSVTLTPPTVSKSYDGGQTYSTTGDDLDDLSNQLLSGDTVTAATLTYADKNAGNGKTVTLGGITVSDGNGGNNYSFSLGSNASSSITPKALTIDGTTASDKIYDGNTTATINAGVLGGLVGSETLTFDVSGIFDGADAGGHTATVHYTLADGTNGGKASNYVLAETTGHAATIIPKTLTIDGTTASDKIYDGNTVAAINAGALSGLVGSETLILGASGVFDGADAGDHTATAHYTLADGTNGGKASNYVLADTTGHAATISAKALDVIGATAQDKVYDGNTAATIMGAVLDGVISGDAVTLENAASGAFASADAANGIAVSTAMGLGGAAAGNYTLNQPVGLAADITPRPLTVTATDQSRSYGAANPGSGNVTLTGGTLVNGDMLGTATLTAAGTATAIASAGTTHTLTPGAQTFTSGLASNYTISYLDGTLTIVPAMLTVTANDANKTYDGLAWGGGNGVQYAGFVNGEDVSVLGGSLSYGGSSQGAINPGRYAITPQGLSASNYTLSFIDGALTIRNNVMPLDASRIDRLSQGGFALGAVSSGLTFSNDGDLQGSLLHLSEEEDFIRLE